MRLQQIAKARIWPQKHRSGNVTWKVRIGKKNDGKDDIRSLSSEEHPRNFHDDWNAKIACDNKDALAALDNQKS